MDGPISGVASNALTSLGSSALQEVAAAWHFKSELDGLTKTITFIRGVLLAREAHRQPHDLDVLIERLKDAVHDADDLIDEVTTLVERKKLMMTGRGRFTKEFQLLFSRENQVGTAFKISREIKRIRNTLNNIVGDRDRFASMSPSNETSSAVIERDTCFFVSAEVIGRDDEKQKILDVLLRHEHHDDKGSQRVVLVIYGIGGLGKTTIAQLVFNDEVVQGHFELKLWVCVGDIRGKEFDIKLIIRKIIMSATGSSCSDVESLDQLHRNLREKMEGQKYLLVLDDLWEEDPTKLKELKEWLPFGENGSTVLVTTRSEYAAEKIGTIRPMKLQCLSDDASWTLFEKMTGLEQRSDQSLVQIGKEIVKKCGNLPLAIKVIGSFLHGENETEWRRFKDCDLAIIDAASGILPLLKLSYYRLLPHLKHCFTYCSLFPKDYDMDPIRLYYLWIAQGFITNSVYPCLTLEEAAEKCLRKLEERCFIQCNYLHGTISTFKMHDLMHDLAEEVAGKEIHIADDNGDQNHMPRGVRHLSFSKFFPAQNLSSYMQGRNHLRTFLRPVSLYQRWEVSDVINDIINSFQCIRVLDLQHSGIKQLPESIGKLIHLRYLNLSPNYFEVLPESITRLHNLETLILKDCWKLKELPWDLSKLVNLSKLDVPVSGQLACMPAGMCGLTRLQRLNRFVVGEGKPASTDHAYAHGRNSKPHIINASGLNDLIPLTNLRGYLEIGFSKKGNSDSMAIRTKDTVSCLLNKSKLTELTIDLKIFEVADASRHEGLLECLQPHPHLKGFNLRHYGGMKFPCWMPMDNLAIVLPNLVVIRLADCSRCLNLPILSRLPSLKSASLWDLPLLEYMESQSYEALTSKSVEFFPSLQFLYLHGLSNVKGWWKPTGDGTNLDSDQHVAHPSILPFFPRLTRLWIDDCPNMTSMPLSPYLEELALRNFNENLNIIMETEEYSMIATSLGPSSTSISSSSAPNYCLSTPLLKRLYVHNADCNRLSKQSLRRPTQLHIFRCKDVALSGSFLQHLTELVELKIIRCCALDLSAVHGEEEDQKSWKSLERLRRLEFCGLPELRILPEGLKYLVNLQELRIVGCFNLVEVPEWISQLPGLRSLEIWGCQSLESPPYEIQDRISTYSIGLLGCDYLKERCKNLTGDDWHKIEHSPEIDILDDL